ncbi:hypothetical protein F4781DRAFT_443196 [Annulohypoxylon bovei var. microspora]|nr:hypothetical protein F4781DRAFT_443196 [Annulohypoxylon bovei var. microspora]
MAPANSKSSGGPQEASNGEIIRNKNSKVDMTTPSSERQSAEASGTGLDNTVSVEGGASTTARSLTSYRRSMSHGDLHNAVEKLLVSASSNTLLSKIRNAADREYAEPSDNVSNTIDRILEGYTAHPMASAATPPHDRSVSRRGFRRDGIHQGSIGSHLGSSGIPPSDLPETPKSATRRYRRAKPILGFSRGSPEDDDSVSDSQCLLDPDLHASGYESAPSQSSGRTSALSMRSRNGQGKASRRDGLFGVASYDDFHTPTRRSARHASRHYPLTLQPTRGRDVSRAFRRVSRVEEASEATIGSSPGSPPFVRKQRSNLPTDNAFANLRCNEGNGIGEGHQDGIPLRDSAETANWSTTEMTSEAGFGQTPPSNRREAIQSTGSSVAGTSENEWKTPNQFGSRIGSRARVLKHPAMKGQPESYKMRNLKDTKQAVLLPKGQPARTGGYPDNSTRFFPSDDSDTHLPSRPSRNIPVNPFIRIDSSRLRDGEGGLEIPMKRAGRSRYEFRDSVSERPTSVTKVPHTLDPLPLKPLPLNIRGSARAFDLNDGYVGISPCGEHPPFTPKSESGDVSFERSSSKVVEVSPLKPVHRRHVDDDYPNRRAGLLTPTSNGRLDAAAQAKGNAKANAKLASSESKFDFELIPLEEAQRINREQRENGERDETESAEERYQRAVKAGSARPIPAFPSHIQRPRRIYTRESTTAPRLSLDFSPSSVFYADALHDLSTPFSATTRRNLAQTEQTPVKSPAATKSHTSSHPTAKRSWLRKMKSRILSQKDGARRVFSTGTTVHYVNMDDDSQLSVAAMEDMIEPYLSSGARARRRRWFLLTAFLSAIFPFIALLVMAGVLDPALGWYTNNEIRRMTIRQRNFIRNMFLAWCCAAMVVAPCLIAVFVKKS